MHLPAARWWKLALRGEMEVYCCVEPARGSLIKLSPGSWNVISSFVIQARIICLHFACDGLLDNSGLGPDDAEAMLMVEGARRSQTATKNLWPVTPWNWKSPREFFFTINLPSRVFVPLHHPACGWCNTGNFSNHYIPLCIFLCSFIRLIFPSVLSLVWLYYHYLAFLLIKIKSFWLLELHCALLSFLDCLLSKKRGEHSVKPVAVRKDN